MLPLVCQCYSIIKSLCYNTAVLQGGRVLQISRRHSRVPGKHMALPKCPPCHPQYLLPANLILPSYLQYLLSIIISISITSKDGIIDQDTGQAGWETGQPAQVLSIHSLSNGLQWRVSVVVSHLRLCMQRPFLPPCVFSMHVGQFFNYNGGTILVFGSTQDFNLFNF